MEAHINLYTVHQLAKLAGVSVRTLHHYDQIGLLKPAARSSAGYRLYAHADLLRLQQILFFRELDFPLSEILAILDRPDFDQVQALQAHKSALRERMQRLTQLIHTLDNTIQKLTEDDMTLTDEELYAGFSKEQKERYEREVTERYDPALVAESKRRVHKMTKAEWLAVKEEGQAITRGMAEHMGSAPGAPDVQQLIARHHAWIEQFYPASSEVYRGLGQLYTENDEFRAHYDQFRPGLADFMRAAMEYYIEHTQE